MRSIDRSFDDLFKGFGTVPIQIVNESRKWTFVIVENAAESQHRVAESARYDALRQLIAITARRCRPHSWYAEMLANLRRGFEIRLMQRNHAVEPPPARHPGDGV